jgi:hypothetical protein
MSKKISEVFDVEPVDNKPNLPTVSNDPSDNRIEDDAELARKNIRGMLDVGNRALENAFEVAVQSESPRAYEVLSNMLKTMADINGQLIDIHDKKKKAIGKTEEQPKQESGNVTNIAFVGTTSELNKLIMEKLNGS